MRKTLSILICFICIFGLVACSNGQPNETSTTIENIVSETANNQNTERQSNNETEHSKDVELNGEEDITNSLDSEMNIEETIIDDVDGTHESDEQYKDWYAQKRPSVEWDIFNDESNTEEDLSIVIIDGVEFDFNELTTSDIFASGYNVCKVMGMTRVADDYKLYSRDFINKSGAGISVVNNPESKRIEVLEAERTPLEGEFMYDEDETQVDCVFFNGLRPGMTKDEVVAAVKDIVAEVKNDDWIILRNDKNTLILSMEEGLLDNIYLVNNELCGV